MKKRLSRLLVSVCFLVFIAEWDRQGYYTMRYNLRNSQVTRLWDNDDGGSTSIRAIHHQRIYFGYYYPSEERGISDLLDERALKVYSSQLNGKDIQEETGIPPAPIIFNTLIDDQYSYVRPVSFQLKRIEGIADELKIYKNSKLVHSIPMSPESVYQSIIVGDERYMFMTGTADNKSYIQYLDKQEIETGTADFKKILED
ncbi:hypothetical protein [Paenibacillus aceti]|uniref:DUF4340 domain-containing protein n=1 Tax=Paenibacillus aceti TaxID=1820010 RepID=A0ABQ1VQM1_9BACL|nr:hypothetical protein [Paenibacillus aceti]GGF88531.1 hypothetical protein GCM10010913_07460 [Paenibacillus aceti]